MDINFVETRKRFDARSLSQAKYVGNNSQGRYDYAVFRQVLNGTYKSMGSPRAQAILSDLRRDGILVEVESEEKNGDLAA